MNPRDFEATQRAPGSSPPNAPGSRPPSLTPHELALVTLVGAMAVAVAGFVNAGTWVEQYALRLWLPLWLMGALLAGSTLLTDRSPWVVKAARLGRHQFVEWGGGAYGAIAIVCFGWLEWARLAEFWAEMVALEDKFGFRELVRSLFDFGLDSFMNGIFAFIWPAFWKKAFTAGQMWPAVIVGWGVFESARWGVRRLAKH